jgi:hypothetical protein
MFRFGSLIALSKQMAKHVNIACVGAATIFDMVLQ